MIEKDIRPVLKLKFPNRSIWLTSVNNKKIQYIQNFFNKIAQANTEIGSTSIIACTVGIGG